VPSDVRAVLGLLRAIPDEVPSLSAEQLSSVLTAVSAILAAVAARQFEPPLSATRAEPQTTDDRLLTVAEAAAIANVPSRWLHRRTRAIPGVRRLGPKTIRLEERTFRRWLATRKP
jgi:hypothetical protein